MGAERYVGTLGTLSVYVALLVQANSSDISEKLWEHGQNLRYRDHPVLPVPGAREGRGSLEGVEIFQVRSISRRFTLVFVRELGGPRPRRRGVRLGFGIILRVRGFACAGK